MRGVMRGVQAAVGLTLIAIGVPLLLVRLAGWPLPTSVPNWSNVYWAVRQQNVPAEFVVKTLAVVAWCVWGQLLWAIAWEAVVNVPRQLRGQRVLRAPAAWEPMTRLARLLVAPLMLLTTAGPAPAAAAAPPLASLLANGGWAGVAPPLGAPAPAVGLPSVTDRAAVWVAHRGDTLWDVAERCLGDGARVDQVLECNPGMTATQRLRPGDRIKVPADARVPADRTSPEPTSLEHPAGPTYVVAPGDTLWDIAAEQLGDPLRWPEVFAANTGRRFDDGRTLSDPDLIQPGWELTVALPPADGATRDDDVERADGGLGPSLSPSASAGEVGPGGVDGGLGPSLSPSASAGEVGPGGVDGEPGSSLSPSASAGEVGPGGVDGEPGPSASISATAGRQLAVDPPGADRAGGPDRGLASPDARSGTDVAWRTDAGREAAPGARPAPVNEWHTEHRPARPEAAAPLAERPVNTVIDGAVLDRRAVPPTDAARERSGSPAEASELVSLPRAAMLASGALLLLGVRRRRALRAAPTRPLLRSPAGAPPEPGPATETSADATSEAVRADADTERTLRAIAADDRFARVDLAVRAATLSLVTHRRRVLAVLVGPDGAVELVPTGHADLDPPWVRAGDRWELPASVTLDDLAPAARRVAAPTPTLVQLGVDGDRDVYVDLEALGALQIDGRAEASDAIVRALATTLATSVLAEVVTLVGVGVSAHLFCGHRHHVEVADPDEAVRTAVAAVGSTASVAGDTFELRARATSGEAWEPAVVLVGAGTGQVPVTPTPGVVVVSASPIVGPSSVLAPDGDAWVLRPSGLRLAPIGLGHGDAAAVAGLLDVEAVPPDPVDHPPRPAAPRPAGPEVTEPYALLVRLLGPVRVEAADGTTAHFERSKTRELVAWLATHRDRSTRTLARTALWELDVRDATFSNVVSEARRALARLVEPPPGEEWIGRTLTEELPLHHRVRTDAELLVEALERARATGPTEAIAHLEPAVAMVTGMPFEGTSYLWPDPEGITSNLVVLATAAAATLAEHHLAIGDVDGVFAATDRGLRVLPGHEELIGLRMRAHARAGDHAGIRQEWESYLRTLLTDPWSDGEPAPKLAALRADLLGTAAA